MIQIAVCKSETSNLKYVIVCASIHNGLSEKHVPGVMYSPFTKRCFVKDFYINQVTDQILLVS